MKQIYKVFSNCIPIKGYFRSIIYDLQLNKYYLIPNSLVEMIDIKGCIFFDSKKFNSEEREIVFEYIKYLESNKLVQKITQSEIKFFPNLNQGWEYPSKITNGIIDIEKFLYKSIDLIRIIKQFEKNQCYHIQIRFFNLINDVEFLEFNKVLNGISSTMIQSIEIIFPNPKTTNLNKYISLVKSNKKIKYLLFYNSTVNKSILDSNFGFGGIYMVKSNLVSHLSCGYISPDYFSINIPTFTESQHHNTCLNRKISIDKDGYIKNCPSMSHHFGHISDTKLEDVIQNPEFTKYWHIKKDEITKCKDCEFRHICTDCRAYRDNPDDLYSAPLKCGYDPYTGVWEEWSTNPLKQKAIEYYGMQDLVKKEA